MILSAEDSMRGMQICASGDCSMCELCPYRGVSVPGSDLDCGTFLLQDLQEHIGNVTAENDRLRTVIMSAMVILGHAKEKM